MKRKPVSHSVPVPPAPVPSGATIDQRLLDSAKLYVVPEKIANIQKCSICSSPCAPNSNEGLCWVCRRLKISAWRDSEQQAAQE
jgi:hypothetical protein